MHGGETVNGHEVSFGVMEIPWNQKTEVGVAQHGDCTKCHRGVCFTVVELVILFPMY